MKSRVLILIAISSTLMNCAKQGTTSAAPSTGNPGVTPGAPSIDPPEGAYTPDFTGKGGNPGPSFTYGGTTDFVFDSVSVYREYTERYISNLNQLSNIKLNLNLDRYGNSFGGTLTIRYNFQGLTYEGFFYGGHDQASTKYNVWFKSAGKNVWHAFFEDFMGGIIVVIDGTDSLADGYQPGDKVNGTIYFKNFHTAAPHPPTYCWFVSLGAFDCRAWKDGYGVNTKKAVHPSSSDGYTKLGTFQNLDVEDAFNGDMVSL